ncbi:hypothetical protein [Hymenobacter sp. NBH84]|uniref:hypothetical protein n=1 Tax=Hymenobacter sp. NBH84 TaxID=2596915 RepID=UPI001626B648|nr:hypothetical protein [Hymenobacter sp. NBH84]
MEVVDTTALTRQNQHLRQHLYVVDWTITGVQVKATQHDYQVKVYPNPVREFITLHTAHQCPGGF